MTRVYKMRCPSFNLLVLVFAMLLSIDVVLARKYKQHLHHHMTRREIERYFGVKDHTKIPEYDIITPHQTDVVGRTMSPLRIRRDAGHSDVLHYEVHAFGSKLRLRLKRNTNLMTSNLVIERHHREGMVTTQSAPKNEYYLGQVLSDPDSLVALKSDRSLMGMIRTSRETLFVQPLSLKWARRVRRNANSVPHLIYRIPKEEAVPCEVQSTGKDRVERSTHSRKTRAASNYKFLEAALIVPKTYEEKYGTNQFATILLTIANMVAAMYQDPSIGKIKVYYVVTKIIVMESTVTLANFSKIDSNSKKLTKMLKWAGPATLKSNGDPDHYDVFSYVSDWIKVGGLAIANMMCSKSGWNGNVNADVGLQTALHVAHEIGHNLFLDHDKDVGCPQHQYIMDATLPSGIYAATWSNCSRKKLEEVLGSGKSWCLDNTPVGSFPTLKPEYHGKLPGEIFDGDAQCRMQYTDDYILSPYQKGVCDRLYCFNPKGGAQLSRLTPIADGAPCGEREWCISGKCVDNGKPRIHGGWSRWSGYDLPCTRPCDSGVTYRTRTCTNPAPSNGGKSCVGISKEWKICNSKPCQEGAKTFREEQCLRKRPGSIPYIHPTRSPCALFCRIGSSVSSAGTAEDGTSCKKVLNTYDVCIGGMCRPVGCDHVLDSTTMVDRCGKCGGDGDECFVTSGSYTASFTVKGLENAELVQRLPIGAYDVSFTMRRSSKNYLAVQADDGTYLVGNVSSWVQEVSAANTVIQYTRKQSKFKVEFKIPGPTDQALRVVYVYVQGGNPGVDYDYKTVVQPSDTPPENKYEWKETSPWSLCSTTCGQGVRTRSARCIRSDDKTPASDAACGEKIVSESCQVKDCPSDWHTTDWSPCSKSCGNGVQTRGVICRKKINPTDYGPSTSCAANKKPSISEKVQYCNSIDCPADWDTEEGLPKVECGEPIDPGTLSCYRLDYSGQKAMVPDLLCRYKTKPTRLPCTTTSRPTEQDTNLGIPGIPTYPDEKDGSQSYRYHSSIFISVLVPVLQILLHYCNLA
ncbi:A disintegrin and metalloproteinase with thrombospondin motifs 18-like isoform X3 [Stylophora pistillata]|uniref:A disintegrin and metalloproteinase with thrombospondin motifs 18-like isoform X3 n=1 Tax=Stylophora pistillata TaxID=50429 RepID=UPI000C045736|nr:A disintegrin and metalloproteinase with thrombospondin motifs 18-like isoform X3 [Stylophora pistillata]